MEQEGPSQVSSTEKYDSIQDQQQQVETAALPNSIDVLGLEGQDEQQLSPRLTAQAQTKNAEQANATIVHPGLIASPDADDTTPTKKQKHGEKKKPKPANQMFSHVKEEESDSDSEAEEDMGCLARLFQKPPPPPKPWTVCKHADVDDYVAQKMQGCFKYIYSEKRLRKSRHRKKPRYIGHGTFSWKHGIGVCWWPDPPLGDGEVYYGVWKNDHADGHGIMIWYDGDTYMGSFQNGQFHGYGILRYSEFYGDFQGDVYEGRYFHGIRQGSGVYYYEGGDNKESGVYMGEWMRGMMQGGGILTFQDGEKYVGQWLEDKKSGLGVYEWGEGSPHFGDKYEGQYLVDHMHGRGVNYFADGGTYKGSYKDGKMHGKGMLTMASGVVILGTWEDDYLEGPAVVASSAHAGSKKVVSYEKGEKISDRRFDASSDWSEIEAPCRDVAKSALAQSMLARNNVPRIEDSARRAKESQRLAKESEAEAKEVTESVIAMHDEYTRFFGLGVWFSDF